MIEFNNMGVASVFLLHAIALPIICPSRYRLAKTAVIWCGSVLICAFFAVPILTFFPNYLGTTIIMCTAGVIYSLLTLVSSSYSASKTTFLFLTYLHAYAIILCIAHLIPHFFFSDSAVVSALTRTSLHICLIALYFFVVRRKFKYLSHDIIKGWWPLNIVVFLLVANVTTLLIRSYALPYNWFEVILFFLLLIITFAIFWMFFHTIGYMKNSASAQRLELQSEFLMQQVKDMQESFENTRRTRHDARHHNLQIAEYVRNRELDELLDYLHQYEEESQSKIPVRICENLTAGNILNAYARKAEKNRITVNFDVYMDQDIGIKDTDIVAILANIMENAILGCIRSKQPQPFIDLFIRQRAGKLAIQSRNTADTYVHFEYGLPKSHHNSGMGIPSILHSASNYGGETDFKNENGVFICRVLLKIPTKSIQTDLTLDGFEEIIK